MHQATPGERRILLVNPNVTEAVTERMAAEARRSASPGTRIEAVTARFGMQYVENRVEAAIAGHAVVEALAAAPGDFDAAIVAAFGDPGLHAAKELLEVPVVGLSEAAFLTAYTLARRYAIVCLTARLGAWYRECAEEHGLAGRLVSVRPLASGVVDITRAVEEAGEALVALCLRAVEEDGAEAVILGGGPIAGLARTVQDRVPVPLLDGVRCAVGLAEMLATIAPVKATRGSFARPGPKPSRGIDPPLARRFGG